MTDIILYTIGIVLCAYMVTKSVNVSIELWKKPIARSWLIYPAISTFCWTVLGCGLVEKLFDQLRG